MLSSNQPTQESTNTEYRLLYFGKDPKDVQVRELWYRGDSRVTTEIFKNGFTARGTNTDVVSHLSPKEPWFYDSAYISTSTSKEVAMHFPEGASQAFLFEVDVQKNAIDVRPHIHEAMKKNKFSLEEGSSLLAQKERAILHRLKPTDIKGAWPVEVKVVQDDSFSLFVRTVGDEYIPNPSYANAVAAKILKTANILGRGLAGVGAAIDGLNLYEAYEASKKSNDFSGFFQEGARVLGGWSGAIALGKATAGVGAAIGTLAAGPVGTAVGTVVGGVAGSIAGYSAGEYLASENIKVADANAMEAKEELKNMNSHSGSHPKTIVEIEMDDLENNKFKSIKSEQPKNNVNSDTAILEEIESKFHITKNINLLHKKMELLMSTVSNADMTQFENEPTVTKLHDELKILRDSKDSDPEKIYEKQKELQFHKTEIMAKRIEFTDTVKKTSYAISGASSVLGIAGESEWAQGLSVGGQSIVTAIENGAALLGYGVLAGSINPLLAFQNIAGATYNIVSLFNPKAPNPSCSAILLPHIKQLSEMLVKFMFMNKDEFSAVKHLVSENHLISLEKFSGFTENQHETLAILHDTYFEMRRSFAAQSDKLKHISNALFSVENKIDSIPYRQDIENLKKHLRFILENTNVDFNELSSELDNIGLENGISHQLNDIFKMIDDAVPLEYFQLANYFNKLIRNSDKPLPNPLVLVYSTIANLLLNLIETPNPQAKYPSERILERDIFRLKNYKIILKDINDLIAHARESELLNKQIDTLEKNAVNLIHAIDKKTLEIEEKFTKEKQMQLDQELMRYRQDLSDRFMTKFPLLDNWGKGTKEHRKRWYANRRWDGLHDIDKNYVDENVRNTYLRETEARISGQRVLANDNIRENAKSSKLNHLSASKKSKISPFHGVGYLIAKDGKLPLLPAPDPLLPPDHPNFQVLLKLQEAQRFGRGYKELEFVIAEKNFSININFNLLSVSNTENPKLICATIKLNDYDPRFYGPEEAVWYYLMGGQIVSQKEGTIKTWHVGQLLTFDDAGQGHGTGHKGGEFEVKIYTINEPKPSIQVEAKINEIYRNNTSVELVEASLKQINELVDAEYVLLQKHVEEELSANLDYTATDDLGVATKAFEESSRNLFGTLSYGYFDLMQDKQSKLAQWFSSHIVNIKRLKENPSREKLNELINDLTTLKKIIKYSNNSKPSFNLLSEVDSILEDFIELYEPNAIEYNDKRPRKEQSSIVADKLTDLLSNLVNNMILGMPSAVTESIIKKSLSESQLELLDENSRNEIQQRILDKLNQKNIKQLPGAESNNRITSGEELKVETVSTQKSTTSTTVCVGLMVGDTCLGIPGADAAPIFDSLPSGYDEGYEQPSNESKNDEESNQNTFNSRKIASAIRDQPPIQNLDGQIGLFAVGIYLASQGIDTLKSLASATSRWWYRKTPVLEPHQKAFIELAQCADNFRVYEELISLRAELAAVKHHADNLNKKRKQLSIENQLWLRDEVKEALSEWQDKIDQISRLKDDVVALRKINELRKDFSAMKTALLKTKPTNIPPVSSRSVTRGNLGFFPSLPQELAHLPSNQSTMLPNPSPTLLLRK